MHVRTLSALGIGLTEIGDHQRAGKVPKESLKLGQTLGEEQIVRVTLTGVRTAAGLRRPQERAATL
jgi:hypothetical protein